VRFGEREERFSGKRLAFDCFGEREELLLQGNASHSFAIAKERDAFADKTRRPLSPWRKRGTLLWRKRDGLFHHGERKGRRS
ncbi:MAG: hypothetical protein AAGK22_21745, partial [Acidobacteriota bacterium]